MPSDHTVDTPDRRPRSTINLNPINIPHVPGPGIEPDASANGAPGGVPAFPFPRTPLRSPIPTRPSPSKSPDAVSPGVTFRFQFPRTMFRSPVCKPTNNPFVSHHPHPGRYPVGHAPMPAPSRPALPPLGSPVISTLDPLSDPGYQGKRIWFFQSPPPKTVSPGPATPSPAPQRIPHRHHRHPPRHEIQRGNYNHR